MTDKIQCLQVINILFIDNYNNVKIVSFRLTGRLDSYFTRNQSINKCIEDNITIM